MDVHGRRVDTGTVALTAGVPAPIVMEYFDASGLAVAQLRWSSAAQPLEIVPTDRLRPTYAVNMQPAGRPVPTGYVADTGAVFGKRSTGLSHGGNADTSTAARDRESTPDQRCDTLIHLRAAPNTTGRWDLAVPNGTYRVRIVADDPTAFDSVFRVAAEGVLVVDGPPTSAARFLDRAATITVTDGRSTLASATGAVNDKVSFVEVQLL